MGKACKYKGFGRYRYWFYILNPSKIVGIKINHGSEIAKNVGCV